MVNENLQVRALLDSHVESIVDYAWALGGGGWFESITKMTDSTDDSQAKSLIRIAGAMISCKVSDKIKQLEELNNA